MDSTVTKTEQYAWVVVLATLVAFAIPWFLWGTDRLLAGLPIWLWWHIGWMILAAASFWTFARRAWGMGVTDGVEADPTAEPETKAKSTEETA